MNVFDKLMIHTCDIQVKGGSADGYNQPGQVLTNTKTGWPCRLTTMAGGHEFRTDKQYAINRFRIFMRLPGVTVDTHSWLTVYTPGGTYKINVEAVNDPSGLGHHLEAIGQVVTP